MPLSSVLQIATTSGAETAAKLWRTVIVQTESQGFDHVGTAERI